MPEQPLITEASQQSPIPSLSSPSAVRNFFDRYPRSRWVLVAVVIVLLVSISILLVRNALYESGTSKPNGQSRDTTPTKVPLNPNIYEDATFKYFVEFPAGWTHEIQPVSDTPVEKQTFHPKNPGKNSPSFSVAVSDTTEYFDYMKQTLSPAEYFAYLRKLPQGKYEEIGIRQEVKLGNEVIDGHEAVLVETTINTDSAIKQKAVYTYREPYLYKITVSQPGANGTEGIFLKEFEVFYRSFKFVR